MSWIDHADRSQLRIHHGDRLRNKEVQKVLQHVMIFVGFDIFMKGCDPRDAHFITPDLRNLP